MTLNFVRALVKGGFADLHHPEYFDLDWVKHSPLADEYHRMVQTINDSLQFVENVLGVRAGDTDQIDFFTAHEALHLGYESAQTRRVPRRPGYFNLLTHFPWVGLRTNDPDGAHIEYLRGIENPVGIKVGAGCTREQVARWLEMLDPDRSPGRLTFIHRFGARQDRRCPAAADRARARRRRQAGVDLRPDARQHAHHWPSGIKTRNFEDIHSEVEQSFDIHRATGQQLGGVHIELTGENVTECIGGARGPNEADLARAYESEVDPRLNYEQSMELAFLIARKMKNGEH